MEQIASLVAYKIVDQITSDRFTPFKNEVKVNVYDIPDLCNANEFPEKYSLRGVCEIELVKQTGNLATYSIKSTSFKEIVEKIRKDVSDALYDSIHKNNRKYLLDFDHCKAAFLDFRNPEHIFGLLKLKNEVANRDMVQDLLCDLLE